MTNACVGHIFVEAVYVHMCGPTFICGRCTCVVMWRRCAAAVRVYLWKVHRCGVFVREMCVFVEGAQVLIMLLMMDERVIS